MSEALILVLLSAVGGLLILGLGLFLFSRFLDHSSAAPIPVGYRRPDGQWQRGRLKVEGDLLKVTGPSAPGPWLRGHLDLGVASAVSPEDSAELGGRVDLIQVPLTYGHAAYELAIDEHNYTALRAWVEAMPPGWNTQVV